MSIDVTVELERGMGPVNGSLVLFHEATRSWRAISPADDKLPTAYVELCTDPTREVIRNIRISDFEDANECAVVHVEVADDENKNHQLIPVTLGGRYGTGLKTWHFVKSAFIVHCVLAKDEEEEKEEDEGCKTPEPPRKKGKRKRKGH